MQKSSKIAIIITLLATALALVFSLFVIHSLNKINDENSQVIEKINSLDDDSLSALAQSLKDSDKSKYEIEEEVEYESYSPEEYAALKHAENSYFLENVPYINQMDAGLPSGCEGVSLTMYLNFLGYDVSPWDVCMSYMPWSWEETNMSNSFIGDPSSDGGWGCYAPVIVKTAYNYFDANGITDKRVINMTGSGIYDIFDEIRNGHPVIIWATESFKIPELNITENFTWVTGEHCMLVTGYDEKNIYFNDPIYGYTSVDLKTFEKIWALLGRQAVVIH